MAYACIPRAEVDNIITPTLCVLDSTPPTTVPAAIIADDEGDVSGGGRSSHDEMCSSQVKGKVVRIIYTFTLEQTAVVASEPPYRLNYAHVYHERLLVFILFF